MSARERIIGVAVVVLVGLSAALVLERGVASAEPRKSPFRTAQISGPNSPEPPLADGVPPPLPSPAAPPAPAPIVTPPPAPPIGTPCPVDPPTPAVSIHVRAPASAAAGQEMVYRITVRNTTRAPAYHVTVRSPLPANATYTKADPKPDQSKPDLVWNLGTLEGCASREIVVVLVPSGSDDVDFCARVQFEHGQCVTTKIARPQLVVHKTGPTEAAVGEKVTFRITVTNTGTVEARDVMLVETLQDGWQLEDRPFEQGAKTDFRRRLGTLAPGQSEPVEYQATPRVSGRLCTSAEATAAGGIISEPARHCVRVGGRDLRLEIDGPATAYARRPVDYFITVKNRGSLPVTGVIVADALPRGLDFVEASQGGRYTANVGLVRWDVGTLAAGHERVLRVRVQSSGEGEFTQRPEATSTEGLRPSTEKTTKFQGAASFDFDVTPSADAVEVDATVRYKVTVFNRGSGAQTNVQIVVELPPELKLKEVKGPEGLKYREDKGRVIFDPLPSLAANAADAVYEVAAVAREVGSARVTVLMRAGGAERFTPKMVVTEIGEKQP